MSDRVARLLAAAALGCALVALALAGWAVYRADVELHELRRGVQQALQAQRRLSLRGPPLTLDEADMDDRGEQGEGAGAGAAETHGGFVFRGDVAPSSAHVGGGAGETH